jgi:hypothetical protein
MAVTHEWGVNPELRTKSQDGHDNVVYQVSWYLRSHETVGEDTYRAHTGGEITLDTSDLSDFTAFADLTEAQVLGWAKAQVDANASGEEPDGYTCAQWETAMENQIAYDKNPPTQVENAPWAAN